MRDLYIHTIHPQRNPSDPTNPTKKDALLKLLSDDKNLNTTLIPEANLKTEEITEDDQTNFQAPRTAINCYANTNFAGFPSFVINADVRDGAYLYGGFPQNIVSSAYDFSQANKFESKAALMENIGLWLKKEYTGQKHASWSKLSLTSFKEKISEIESRRRKDVTDESSLYYFNKDGSNSKIRSERYTDSSYAQTLPNDTTATQLRHNECHVLAGLHHLEGIMVTREDYERNPRRSGLIYNDQLFNSKAITLLAAKKLADAANQVRHDIATKAAGQEKNLKYLVNLEILKVEHHLKKVAAVTNKISYLQNNKTFATNEWMQIAFKSKKAKNPHFDDRNIKNHNIWLNSNLGYLNEELATLQSEYAEMGIDEDPKSTINEIIELAKKSDTLSDDLLFRIATNAIMLNYNPESKVIAQLQKKVKTLVYDKEKRLFSEITISDKDVKLDLNDPLLLHQLVHNNLNDELRQVLSDPIQAAKLLHNANNAILTDQNRTLHVTPIGHFAASCDNIEALSILCSLDKSILNKTDGEGKTAAFYAIENGNVKILEFFANQGVNLAGLRDLRGNSLAHIAAALNHVEVLKYLISQKVDINSQDNANRKPVHVACRHGALDSMEFLLEQNKSNEPLLADGGIGCELIRTSIQYKETRSLDYLIKRGVNPRQNFSESSKGEELNIFDLAAMYNSVPTFDYLQQNNLTNDGCFSTFEIFSHAIQNNSIKALNFLLKRSSYILTMVDNFHDLNSECYSHDLVRIAVKYNAFPCLTAILNKSENLRPENHQSVNLHSKLLSAAIAESIKIENTAALTHLCQHHGAAQYRTNNGLAASHYAASKGNIAALQELSRFGSTLNIKDNYHKSPIDYAIEANQATTLDFFLRNVNHNQDPWHLLKVAAKSGSIDCIKLLLETPKELVANADIFHLVYDETKKDNEGIDRESVGSIAASKNRIEVLRFLHESITNNPDGKQSFESFEHGIRTLLKNQKFPLLEETKEFARNDVERILKNSGNIFADLIEEQLVPNDNVDDFMHLLSYMHKHNVDIRTISNYHNESLLSILSQCDENSKIIEKLLGDVDEVRPEDSENEKDLKWTKENKKYFENLFPRSEIKAAQLVPNSTPKQAVATHLDPVSLAEKKIFEEPIVISDKPKQNWIRLVSVHLAENQPIAVFDLQDKSNKKPEVFTLKELATQHQQLPAR